MNHSLLPSVAKATLPERYEAAKAAIAECNRVDECKDWADKAAALASYAKQADDTEMEKTAMRIRARASRRCGELLKEIEAKHTGRIRADAAPNSNTRKSAAQQAGMSERQSKDAIRLANVPEDDFEDQVESESPPTITALAKQGTAKSKSVPHYEQQGMTKEAFRAGMHFRGHLISMANYTNQFDPQLVADGSTPEERKEIRRNMDTIERYFDKLIAKL